MLFVQPAGVVFCLQAFTDQISGDVAVHVHTADDNIFDFFFQQIVQLVTVPVKKLDTVVFKAVV